MITHHDLQEAIAECQGAKSPNANTCIKLAAYYTIMDNLYPREDVRPQYSYAPAPDSVRIDSGSDFAEAVNGKKPDEVWPVIDELMTTLQIIQPRLYSAVMAKLY